MVSLAEDLKLGLDRVAFAREAGLEPDAWQENLLHSSSDRVLLNCSRQSGKSTMTAVIALHRALYHPGSLDGSVEVSGERPPPLCDACPERHNPNSPIRHIYVLHGFPPGRNIWEVVDTESVAREGEGRAVIRVEYDDLEPDPTPEDFGL
jgi:hypothetical protein